jgi:CDP-paratose synthetase
MRILITGATGFVGSHLARAFLSRGDEVRAPRRATSRLDRLADVTESIDWRDVAEPATTLLAGVDVVLHAATHYGRASGGDAGVEEVNFVWPAALLAAVGPRTLFVNVDTSLPPALSEYARTKRRFADHAREVAGRGAARVLNVNLESVYGPGDDPAKFQMQLIHALLRNDPSFALTDGAQMRDYIFISDAVDAILRLVDHARAKGDSYLAAGVGRGESVSIRAFAEAVRDGVGGSTELRFGALPYRDGELMRACADVSLLRALGWPGGRPLAAGLRETIASERAR